MSSALLRLIIAVTFFLSLSKTLYAQNAFSTGLNGTVIDLPCNQNCVNRVFQVPHLKTTSDYAVTSIPYAPYAYVTPGGTEDPNIYNDDRYGTLFDLPFPFCFYDSLFNKVSVSSNGVITFDYGLQGCTGTLTAPWNITNTIPFNPGTASCNGGANDYPRASIMGVFQDLDPRPGPSSPTINSSPADRKIEWRVEGTAPFRRFIVSYYKIGVYQQTACGTTTPAIFQIVIYESTAIIEIYLENKSCSATSPNGTKAILGIQNWARDKGKAAPGKNAQTWTSSNEGYRFTPSGDASRFVSCELLTLAGAPVATGDTITTTAGLLDVTFQNFCQTTPTAQYVIKTIYSSCDNASNQIIIQDTITVNKTNALNATAAVTQTNCGVVGTGTSTVTVPTGVGTSPFTYVLNPGNVTLTGTSPQQFTALTAGSYTIAVTDASGGCSSSIPITITSTGVLSVNYTVTGTACPGANNGSITVNPPNGTPPITYSINGGVPTTNNVFSNLVAGTYFITTQDAAGCTKNFDPVPVPQGTGTVTGTATPTATSCAGVNNGSILVQATSGSGPYQYSINNGTTWQTSNTFNGLAPGTYNVLIREAGTCTSSPISATITSGAGIQANISSTSTTCTGVNNGGIQVNPTTGSSPYTFVLDGTVTQSGATANFNGVSTGSHSVTITDAAGCVTSSPLTITVTAGAGFTATYTSVNSSCTGATNGSITVTPGTGGTGPYTFKLGTTTQTGAANTTFNGLASGTYSILITDANGCQFTLSNATVNANPGFTATYTSTNSTCTGATNGSLTVTPGAGGTGPYTFVLNGTSSQTGATNTTFNGLASGTYSILITDANGCQFTLSNATVNANTGFTATYTSTNSTCSGATNGSLTVTPGTGGVGPFSFVLNGTVSQTGATNTTFTGLASGSYNVLITDANGCQFTLNNATVNASAGFTASYTASATSCLGAADGSLTLTPDANGVSPFSFVLDGAVTQNGANSATFINVASGTHSILITDANGCQFNLSNATVTAGPSLGVNLTPTNTSCPGVNNGSVVATPTNGAGGYTFVLDGTVTQTGATSTTFTGLAPGSHTMLATSSNGCSSNITSFNIGTGSGITATVNPIGTSCTGATNGSITITPTNGTGPYTFVLNGTTTQTGSTFVTFGSLAANSSYSIAVTDALGCTGTFSNINVPQGSALLANTVPTSTSCNGASNGQILVTPANGGGPYTFVLNGTVTQTGATSTTFTALSANNYDVVITDAAGCVTGAIPVTVGAGPAITVTPSKTDAICFNTSTGTISAVASANATAPVEFSLNNTTWQTSPGFTNLPASNYTVYIRDAVGCTNSASITITQPTQLTLTSSVQNVSCNGLSDGKISITGTGGTPSYTYSIDNINFQTGNSFNVPSGSYTLYLKDANNCLTSANSIVVTQPALLTATAVASDATCDGGNDGTINVNPAGGTTPYQYAIVGSAFQSSSTLNAAPGTYDVSIKDFNGCTYQVTGVVVGLTNNLTLTPAIDPAAICEGSSVQLQLTTNATQFAWTPATDLDNAAISSPVASPKTTTQYSVVATLGRCSVNDDVLVTVMTAPVPDAGPDGDICYGQTYQLQPIGDPTFTYNWSPSSNLSSATGFSVISTPDKTITYTLKVTDNNGCSSLLSDQVTVNVTPPIQVTTYPVDTVVYAGAQIPLLAISGGTSYSWSPAAGLDNPNIPNPVATAPGTEGAVVIYKVTTSTSAGCQGDGFITVKVYKGPDIYVANAFTPNDDGKNDIFVPFPVGIKQLSYFRVYNRWGQLLFSTNTLNEGWDGRFGGLEQQPGVYVWMAEGITTDNKKITKRGTVTLIR